MARFDTYANKPAPASNDTVLIYDSENGNNKQVKMIDLALATVSMSNKYISVGTDLNTLETPGFYYCTASSIAATIINSPVTNSGFSLIVMKKSVTTWMQVIVGYTRIYIRTKTSGGWQDWKSTAMVEEDVDPIKEQIGALRYVEFLVDAGATKTFTLPNAIQFKLITMSITTACMSEVLIVTANNGNLFYTEILKGTSITIDYSVKNKLTLTNSGAYGMRVRFLIFTAGKTITMDEEAATTTESTT